MHNSKNMIIFKSIVRRAIVFCAVVLYSFSLNAQSPAHKFRVVAFYTGRNDRAHISFVNEAKRWFPEMAAKYNFAFEATTNWSQLNAEFLKQHQVVLFLDTRPDEPAQRKAFEDYMEHGGAWMGFHFAGFALTPSDFPQNWNWYHKKFLGAGEYVGNTWRPTSAILRVEDTNHPVTRNLPQTFKSAPNEWYKWKDDLRANPDIKVLLSIDPASFPLGTGPKPHEIWHGGDYPVVWTNQNYKMIYFNTGHNHIAYQPTTNKQSPSTFNTETETNQT